LLPPPPSSSSSSSSLVVVLVVVLLVLVVLEPTPVFIAPLQGLPSRNTEFPGRCPGLPYVAPSGLEKKLPDFPWDSALTNAKPNGFDLEFRKAGIVDSGEVRLPDRALTA
jgi:hypothetical protein